METVDLRKVEGVIRTKKEDDVARRNRYIKHLLNDIQRGEQVKISFTLNGETKTVKSKNAEKYLINLFLLLNKGQRDRQLVNWILDNFARETLAFEQLRQIAIKVERINS